MVFVVGSVFYIYLILCVLYKCVRDSKGRSDGWGSARRKAEIRVLLLREPVLMPSEVGQGGSLYLPEVLLPTGASWPPLPEMS